MRSVSERQQCVCRSTIQNVGNILGALYLSMLFLGIINSRTVQPVAAAERAVRP